MIWIIGLSLLITPPALWLCCYRNIVAQPHPDTCQYLTAEQAKRVLVKRTLASGALKAWTVYAVIAIYSIYIMMS